MGKARQARRAANRLKEKESALKAIQREHTKPKRGQEKFYGVNNRDEVFEEGIPALDLDERNAQQTHTRIRKEARNKSVNAPANTWTDVPQGMVAAPGTYVDSEGVLRLEQGDSCVVWHNGNANCGPTGQRGDYKKVIQPREIIYDPATGAPWCPMCFARNTQIRVFGQPHAFRLINPLVRAAARQGGKTFDRDGFIHDVAVEDHKF